METVWLIVDKVAPYRGLADRMGYIRGVGEVKIFPEKIVHSIIPSPNLTVIFVEGRISNESMDILFGMVLRMFGLESSDQRTIDVQVASGSGWAACNGPRPFVLAEVNT